MFWALLERIPGGWSEVVTTAGAAGKFADPEFLHRSEGCLHVLGRARRSRTHAGDARHHQFLVQRLLSARSAKEAAWPDSQRVHRLPAQFTLFLVIGAMQFTYYQHVPRLCSAARRNPALICRTHAHRRCRRLHRRRHRRGSASPSINSMAAVTVRDFYMKFVAERQRSEPDAFGAPIDDWLGIVRSVSAWQLNGWIGLCWMRVSPVLSLASGPCWRISDWCSDEACPDRRNAHGMIAGAAVLVMLWRTEAVAWTCARSRVRQ